MPLHREPSPLAGRTVRIKADVVHPQFDDFGGSQYKVEDWWDRVAGVSWMHAVGNPACMIYAMRSGFAKLPTDDQVLYGKIRGLGHLIHVSEIEELEPEPEVEP